MTHTLADRDSGLRWRSGSGHTRLVDDQGYPTLHTYGPDDNLTGTDRLDDEDVRTLMLALATGRTQFFAVAAAHIVTDSTDPYPLFTPETDMGSRPVVQCQEYGCGRTIRDPWPWWDFDTGEAILLGPVCYARRQEARELAAGRGDQLALTDDEESGNG